MKPVAHLLFDAVNRGSGQLVVCIYNGDGTKKLAEGPPLYLKLQDVKEMCQRWTVDNGSDAPATTASLVPSSYSYQPSDTFTFSTNAPFKWFGGFNQAFFVSSRNGQVYSKVSLSFNINENSDDFMDFSFRGVANINHSRNWEDSVNTQ
jgi:hypothetical protein